MKRDKSSMSFHVVTSVTMSSNVATVVVNPGLSTRLTTEADGFNLFRVKSLKFRILPTALLQAVGYFAGISDTPPATNALITELLSSTQITATQVTPTDWISVGSSELMGPFPWYKTVPGTTDASEESPGTLAFRSSGATDVVVLELRGEFEFKDPIAAANTPEELMLKEKMRKVRAERLAQLRRDKVLGYLTATKPGQ